MRNFEVLSVEESPGGPGPDRAWKVHYKAYVKKQWKTDVLWMIARNANQAKERAMARFSKVSL
jgi:hypothetical protein